MIPGFGCGLIFLLVAVDGASGANAKLVGTPSPLVGVVEVLHEQQWGKVCGWDATEAVARVACRSAGLSTSYASVISGREIYGDTTKKVWLTDVECYGTEASLVECRQRTVDPGDCGLAESYLTVVCANSAPVADYPLRFLGADAIGREGLLQIQVLGVWGSVCSTAFYYEKVRDVACRKLGFQNSRGEYADSRQSDNLTLGWLTEIKCTGDEASFTECSEIEIVASLCRPSGTRCDEVSKYEGDQPRIAELYVIPGAVTVVILVMMFLLICYLRRNRDKIPACLLSDSARAERETRRQLTPYELEFCRRHNLRSIPPGSLSTIDQSSDVDPSQSARFPESDRRQQPGSIGVRTEHQDRNRSLPGNTTGSRPSAERRETNSQHAGFSLSPTDHSVPSTTSQRSHVSQISSHEDVQTSPNSTNPRPSSVTAPPPAYRELFPKTGTHRTDDTAM